MSQFKATSRVNLSKTVLIFHAVSERERGRERKEKEMGKGHTSNSRSLVNMECSLSFLVKVSGEELSLDVTAEARSNLMCCGTDNMQNIM